VQSDPIGLAGGVNTFAYVLGQPTRFADPRGLDNPGMGPYSATLAGFLCFCTAAGPGADTQNAKICGYSCECNCSADTGVSRSGVRVGVENLAQAARSRQPWDAGSFICYGQYQFFPRPGSDAWQSQTRFGRFSIDQTNRIAYPLVNTSIGIQEPLPGPSSGRELSDALQSRLPSLCGCNR
jgi:hypothetical protein